MRVVLADPPAFTPTYDHELAASLARAGADVELVTSHFRFGDAPAADGYARRELFYPLSSRLFQRSRLRLPLKLAEHPLGLAALRARRADVLHLQWLVPEIDRVLLRPHSPSVFTAHDLLPRRTAAKRELWRRLLTRFDRIVVHSQRGRETLGELGVDAHVIPHPVFPSDPERRDNGLEVDWRLGYLPRAEVDRALGEATVAIFPYRPELDQSGALLRALGAGVPAVAYDVGGVAEPVRAFGAGAVVPAGDVDALAAAVHSLLSDSEALERARAGARRAREELTWDASARAHLALYEEIA
jgi:glycosyltransferase involved in cell wall biosynthesis